MKIVLCTGGYDPIHSGHIAYFKAARALGDKLVVGINTDAWLVRKKGQAFMPIAERATIVESLAVVDHCVLFNDDDGSAIEAIRNVQMMYPNDQIIFANGGDRTAKNIPEMAIKGVIFKFGVGGEDKINSSSWILEEWKAPKTERVWGNYRVIYDHSVLSRHTKVKELVVMPGQTLSLQKHQHRNEFWHVVDGMCNVLTMMESGYKLPARTLGPHQQLDIVAGEWHQLSNPFTGPCKLIEVQFGSACDEDDIERKIG